jgi:hypothetical protein
MQAVQEKRVYSYTAGFYRFAWMAFIALCFIDLRPVGRHRLNLLFGAHSQLVTGVTICVYLIVCTRVAHAVVRRQYYEFSGRRANGNAREFGLVGGNDIARWTAFVIAAVIVYMGYLGVFSPMVGFLRRTGCVFGCGSATTIVCAWILSDLVLRAIFGSKVKRQTITTSVGPKCLSA